MSKYTKKRTKEEKKAEIEALTQGMEQKISNYFHSPEDLKSFLTFMSKFYKYSPYNVSLINSQFDGAQAVGSFKFWKEKGFSVKKGEKAIKILVPNRTSPEFEDENKQWLPISKATKEQLEKIKDGHLKKKEGRLYFSLGSVFDVSQTNATAKDLPSIFPNRWLDGEVKDYTQLYKGMEAIAEKNGIKIVQPYSELGAAKGVSYTLRKEVALNPRNSELQNVKTLLHELTHAKLHTKETFLDYSPAEKEFQAEMTAYTISAYFGLDTSDYSLGYLHSWTKGRELNDQKQLLKEVHETAFEFIETIEESLTRNHEIELTQNKEQEVETKLSTVKEQVNDKEYVETLTKEEEAQKDLEKDINLYDFSKDKLETVSLAELKHKVSAVIDEKEKGLKRDDFIPLFNQKAAGYFTTVPEIKRPHIVIEFSENDKLQKNMLLPFKEGNEFISNVIDERRGSAGFDKTRYHVVFPRGIDGTDKMKVISAKLDMGDGFYSSPYEQILHEKRALSPVFKQALEKEVNTVEGQKDITKDNEKQNDKDILLVEYGYLSSTKSEFVSINELKEMDDKKPIQEQIPNKEKMSDQEFLKAFNQNNQEKMAAISENQLDRPHVLIQWSESGSLKKNELIPLKEANERMAEIIRENKDDLGYYKTRYHVILPKELESSHPRRVIDMDRLDLGDGFYSSPFEQILDEQKGLSAEVIKALGKEIAGGKDHEEEKIHENELNAEEFKSLYKEQVLSGISKAAEVKKVPTTQDVEYKKRYKQEVVSYLENNGNEKSGPSETKEEKEKREKEMKKFEETHSFDHVYKLKKEVLNELKDQDLSKPAMERLKQLEKALDEEKKEHDSRKAGDKKRSNEPSTRMEKREAKKVFKKKAKKQELDRD